MNWQNIKLLCFLKNLEGVKRIPELIFNKNKLRIKFYLTKENLKKGKNLYLMAFGWFIMIDFYNGKPTIDWMYENNFRLK